MKAPVSFESYASSLDITQQPRDDGDFLSPETPDSLSSEHVQFLDSPDYNPVARMRELRNPRIIGDVLFRTLEYTMEDGTRHIGSKTQLLDGKPHSSVEQLMTTAWTTGHFGMNRYDQWRLASDHRTTSILIGPQQNFRRIGSLTKAAHNLIEIGIHNADKFGHDPELFTAKGKSRGGMTAAMAKAMDSQHGANIVYFNSIAPALADGLWTPKTLVEVAKKLPYEISGAFEVASMPHRRLRHILRSLDMQPLAIAQQFKEVPGLTNSDVGRVIRTHMDKEAFGYIDQDENDGLAHVKSWLALLATGQYPHIIHRVQPGGSHIGSCASERSNSGIYERDRVVLPVVADNVEALRSLGRHAGASLREHLVATSPVFTPPEHPHDPPLAA